jgi:hypothetical protein
MTTVTEALARVYIQGKPEIPTALELAEFSGWLGSQWDRLPFNVRLTNDLIDPTEAFGQCAATGELMVSTVGSDHPWFTRRENLMFRAVHDWHHMRLGAGFDLLGEMRTYWLARSLAPQSIWWILRSEIVLQAAAAIHTGRFQPQKLVKIT